MTQRVGFFDSGVGGLTVLRGFLQRYPDLSFVYLGDTAHCPYGDRPLAEVTELATEAVDWLIAEGCGPIMFACNISSSVALEPIRDRYPDHETKGLLNDDLARRIRNGSTNNRVGVIATTGTVESGRYRELLEPHGLTVEQQACPQLVPLVESGRTSGSIVRQTLEPLLDPLLDSGIDTLVLGCTHYPFLLEPLNQLLPASVRVVDPGRVLGETTTLAGNGSRPKRREVRATGSTESLLEVLERDNSFQIKWLGSEPVSTRDTLEPTTEVEEDRL